MTDRSNDPLINPRIKVGTFNVPITISNPSSGASITLDALVDSGATLSVAPGSVLRQLGIESLWEESFELADGSHVTLPVGDVRVTVEGRTVPSVCVFGPEGVAPILGVVVLETAGLTIDPRRRRLVRTHGLLL